jgi:hypothetical protein
MAAIIVVLLILNAPEDCLRRGTIMVFLGISLGIGYFVLQNTMRHGPPDWLLGLGGAIVALTGLGNLVYYFIARNRHGANAR